MCILNNRQFSYALNLTFVISLSFIAFFISFVRSFILFFTHCFGQKKLKKITFDVVFGCCWCCCCRLLYSHYKFRGAQFNVSLPLQIEFIFKQLLLFLFSLFFTMSFEFHFWSGCCCVIGHGLYRRIRSLMIWMTYEKKTTYTHIKISNSKKRMRWIFKIEVTMRKRHRGQDC